MEMLVGVASLPPSLIPALWNIGILHHEKAKLPIHLQQSVYPSQAEIRNWARMNHLWHTSARAATGGKVALFQENSSGSEIFSLQIWTSLIPLQT